MLAVGLLPWALHRLGGVNMPHGVFHRPIGFVFWRGLGIAGNLGWLFPFV